MSDPSILVSSGQRQFTREHAVRQDYLRDGSLVRRFIDVFWLEYQPASARHLGQLYLGEVDWCDLYIGPFGIDYGVGSEAVLSPTEQEFERATAVGVYRPTFGNGGDDGVRHPKMRAWVRGTAFQIVDKGVDFVLSEFSLSVGTRAKSVRAPMTYEIPRKVVTEAVVSAVAHRDRTSNSNAQVIFCSDRLEVWNPSRLPPPLDSQRQRAGHGSMPVNQLIAESLYLTDCIERLETGMLDMISRCTNAGLLEPNLSDSGHFVTTAWRTTMVKIRCNERPVSDANVSMLLPNGTWKRSTTNEASEAILEAESGSVPLDVFVDAKGFNAHVEQGWVSAVHPLSPKLQSMDGGAAIFTGLTGELPGVNGLFRLTRGTQGQIHLAVANVSINDGQPQPVRRSLGEELHLMDSDGRELAMHIVDVVGRSAIVEYRASRHQGSPWPESLGTKALRLLADSPKSKADLSRSLGQEEVSCQLNKVVRQLLAEGMIKYTVSDKPRSCLQKYRVTAKGMDAVATLNQGSIEP